jgi:hypothetical protein
MHDLGNLRLWQPCALLSALFFEMPIGLILNDALKRPKDDQQCDINYNSIEMPRRASKFSRKREPPPIARRLTASENRLSLGSFI